MTRQSRYSAPALEKGFDIVEYLSATKTPRSQAEIAQALERSPNEIYRPLVVLESRGYLVRDAESGKYSLSLKLFSLAHAHSSTEQLRQAAQVPMVELSEMVRHSCHLSIPYNDRLLVVSQVRGPNPVAISISRGTLFPLISTVSGRVLLSNFNEDRRLNFLQEDAAYQKMNKKQQQELHERLDSIRQEGSHSADSEITLGVTDFAAFVGQAGTDLMAAVAVSSLTTGFDAARDQANIIKAVMKAAAAINKRIGIQVA